MKKLIGVCTHDFSKGVRVGKMHLAFEDGKTFCGFKGMVQTGDYLSKKWIASHSSEVCEICSWYVKKIFSASA